MDRLLFPREGDGGNSHKKRRGCLPFHLGVFNCRFWSHLKRSGPIQSQLRAEREEIIKYSYFEKGCGKKCTRQSRRVLLVVLGSLFFEKI